MIYIDNFNKTWKISLKMKSKAFGNNFNQNLN
jgi:hypothetical protein